MNPFDLHIILFLNKFGQRSPAFDTLMVWLVDAELFKGGVVMALLWWAWFGGGARGSRSREVILATLAAAFVALFCARAMAWTLPFRLRPMFSYPPPFGAQPQWRQWSSFPSDHATLFFTLAAGLFYVSPRAAILAGAYVFAVICLPRVYLGLHYPTDIIAGALLGVSLAWAANTPRLRRALARPGLEWLRRDAGTFYAVFFLLTYQIATLFIDLRNFHHVVMDALHRFAQL